MKRYFRKIILIVINVGYKQILKRFIFRWSAEDAHYTIIQLLKRFDNFSWAIRLASFMHHFTFSEKSVSVGGVQLTHPLILAAGFIKGDGFATENDATTFGLRDNTNIIPGWRIIPALVGPVEFGSYTRYPRIGNAGTVIWRDVESQSTQNRVGLKNPGAMAAAKFLGQRKKNLPKEFGINIAISPGVEDINQQEKEVVEALEFFIAEGVIPTWFTLNISCPNTEDDPHGNQLEAETKQLCSAFINHLKSHALATPLWVKVSPALTLAQYRMLIRICNEVGVKAIIATNTLAKPSPDDRKIMAGVGGGKLFEESIMAVAHLRLEKIRMNYDIDIIGCGGIINGLTYRDYQTLGIEVAQYWSAIVYRGPFAAAIIESELPKHDYKFITTSSESVAQH